MVDKYQNFAELSRHEREFQVLALDRGSEVTIIAPHGGRIEPNTSEVAALIAADRYNLFCFNGLKQEDNRDLHLTSHKFDHPQALALVSTSRYVVAVHGCTLSTPMVYLGGLDIDLIEQISRQLSALGIAHESTVQRLRGTHQHNICNRGREHRGVQLELSRGVRDSETARHEVASAVRSVLSTKKTGRGKGVTSPVSARKNG